MGKKSYLRNGFYIKKKPVRKNTILIPENVVAVKTTLIKSRNSSSRKHALSLNLSSRILRQDLHSNFIFHSYKVQVVQELKSADFYSHTTFCRIILTGDNLLRMKNVCTS